MDRNGQGGRAPEYIRNDPNCLRIIQHFFAQEKPVAQLCHGPLALAAAGVLKGRRTAAYPALEPDVKAAGGEFIDSAVGGRRRNGFGARMAGSPVVDERIYPLAETVA